MTRIIGGTARGRTLRTPAGKATRPTSDRVREALFSSLEATFGTLRDTAFLDAFAGSGAVGLEAASRGATWVTFVERERSAAAVIAANARALGFGSVGVFAGSASTFAASAPSRAFDVAFVDPPYDVRGDTLASVLVSLAERGWLAPGAVVVVERSRRSDTWEWPAGFQGDRHKRYGDTLLWYGRFEPTAAAPELSPPASTVPASDPVVDEED